MTDLFLVRMLSLLLMSMRTLVSPVYVGLNTNGPCSLKYLNTWSPVENSLWRCGRCDAFGCVQLQCIFSQHFSVACMRPHGLCSVHFSISIGVILFQFILRQPCCGDFVSVVSDITRRDSFTENSLSCGPYTLSTSFSAMFPKS